MRRRSVAKRTSGARAAARAMEADAPPVGAEYIQPLLVRRRRAGGAGADSATAAACGGRLAQSLKKSENKLVKKQNFARLVVFV